MSNQVLFVEFPKPEMFRSRANGTLFANDSAGTWERVFGGPGIPMRISFRSEGYLDIKMGTISTFSGAEMVLKINRNRKG